MKYPERPFYRVKAFSNTAEMQKWLNGFNDSMRVVSQIKFNDEIIVTIARERALGE